MAIDEYEQHRLLVMIEQMQREGRSEHDIVAAVRDATCEGGSALQPSLTTRVVSRRLVGWTLARIRI